MQIVQFLHHHAAYNGGEIAGFPKAEADDLVKRHIATEYEVADTTVEALTDGIDTPSRRRRRNG